MAEFGKAAGNRYVCQLGSIRNPNLSKGDALGRGLLNDDKGQLDPFKLEELFHRSLISAVQAISEWDDMTFFDKQSALKEAVASACGIVGIPPIQVGSWLTNGDPQSAVATSAACYHAGRWYVELSRPRLMNPQERIKDKARALELASHYSRGHSTNR